MQQIVPNTYDDLEEMARVWKQLEQGRHVGVIETSHAAERDSGANLVWYSGDCLFAELEDRTIPVVRFVGPESAVSSTIVRDKQLAKELMAAAGVSVPGGKQVASADEAVRAQAEIGTAVVVKPLKGHMGHGVTVNISDEESIRHAYDRAAVSGRRVIVEQYVEGDEYRAHATPQECVGLFRRILPSVTGDGYSTVEELVEKKNELRKRNPSTRRSPIPVDAVAEGFLGRNGLAWNSILPEGQTVVVRDVNGLTSGGESEQCLETASEEIKTTAVNAVAAIPGMSWGGVDILVEKATGIPYVIELNSDAAFYGSAFPIYGKPRDVGAAIWEALRLNSHVNVLDPIGELTLNEKPVSVRDFADADLDSNTLPLVELFQRHLRYSGMRLRRYGPSIWVADSNASSRLWFRGLRTVQDGSSVVYPLRWTALLRKVLRRAGIKVPRGRVIRKGNEYVAFRDRYGESLQILPVRDPGTASFAVVVPPNTPLSDPALNPLTKNGLRRFIQVHEAGLRYRVIASNRGALAVVASKSQAPSSQEQIDEAVRVAVESVRAVPQLRWASVNVVIPTDAVRLEGLVEGMSFRPVFLIDDVVIAGSLEDVFRLIISGASGGASDEV